MNKKDRKCLEANGIMIECESPFEISINHEKDGLLGRATGYFAEVVLDWMITYYPDGGYQDD